MSNNKKYENCIKLIQIRYKYQMHTIRTLNIDIDKLYKIIYGLMRRIHESFRYNIILQYKYNNHINKLDTILTTFKQIPRPLKLSSLLNITIIEIRELYKYIIDEIKNIISECGALSAPAYWPNKMEFSLGVPYMGSVPDLGNRGHKIEFTCGQSGRI